MSPTSPVTVPQAYALALERHRAGRLLESETLCRQILAVQPGHGGALNCLGIIAAQAGRHEVAVASIRQAIALHPDSAAAHSNLGEAYRLMGRLEEAVAAFRRALQLQPDFPEAHNNLGLTLAGQGRFEEAAASHCRALELRPNYPEAGNNLGNALAQLHRLDEAIIHYRRALELRPEFPEALNNLGNALKDQSRFDEAVTAYHRAIQLRPDYPQVQSNLSIALREQGELDAAVAACRRALELKPDYPEAYHNLGAAMAKRGQFGEAEAAYRRALQLRPGHPETHVNLGVALAGQRQFGEAIAAYHRALELRPDLAEAHINLGVALWEQGQRDDALEEYRRAIRLKPDKPEAHNHLGYGLKDQGQVEEAVAAFRRAIQLKPDYWEAHSNLVYTLHFHPTQDDKMIHEEKQRWNRQFAEPLTRFVLPHANDRSPERRLRIGYLSPNFRDHVIGRNLLPLFKNHERERFEMVCYSGVARPDRFTEEIRQLAGQWRSTVGMADEALAALIREDGVDILVDVTQHMAGDRLPVFARKPAPIQVSFAGYPASTGLEAIGYRISDRYLEGDLERMKDEGGRMNLRPSSPLPQPNGTGQVFLLDSFWCYDPCGAEVKVNELPAKKNGWVTFGSLNNFCKVNEPVLKLWARVMAKVKDSRLLLLCPEGSHRRNTLEILERGGIEEQRVEFVMPRLPQAYLELYHRLDVVLDPFPYGGHTTSLDALWMGVPVVSLAGERAVSRAGLSQMSNLGLEQLVAFSENDYTDIAVHLAHDLQRLSEMRVTLRSRMQASVLMDAPRFARNIENAYRTMWQQWCAENPSYVR